MPNYQLQDRDYDIAKWIDKLKAAQTDHVAEYFWNDSKKYKTIQARRRLNAIYTNRNNSINIPRLKKHRIHINAQNTYYTCSKKKIEHQLQLTNFMVKLRKILNREIPNHWWQTEYKAMGIQADMILRIEMEHFFFIESHNKQDKFDYEKYDRLYLKGIYDKYYKDLVGYLPKDYEFPKIIILSNKKIKIPRYTDVKFIKMDDKFSNIRDMFK